VNRCRLVTDRAEAVGVMEDVAGGRLDERALAAWIQAHIVRE
jgi:hypothetical protein